MVKILLYFLAILPTLAIADDYSTSNSNKVYLSANGSDVSVTIDQNGSRNRVYGVDATRAVIDGINNTVNIKQTGRNLIRLDQVGNNNTVITDQVNVSSGYQNVQKISVTGNNVSVSAQQNTTGNNTHSLEMTVVGNGHNVAVDQRGGGEHRGTINLINAGGSSNITLTQIGNTNQTYNIQQSCASLNGCSVSVVQGN